MLNVHIIDDDIDDIFLIRDILKRGNETSEEFDVSHSPTLSDGLLSDHAKGANIILLDLSLPDASGFEGLKQLKQKIPSSNVIILTGYKDQDIAIGALQKGASDFLNKNSLNREVLVKSIRYCHERRKLEENLRQSQKLEAVGQMAGGIAHDFNNQLGVMSLLIEKLETQAEGNLEISGSINELSLVVEKCSYMTKQILGFSRKSSLFPKTISLNMVVDQIVPFAKRLLGSEIQFTADTTDDAGYVYIDPNQLEQVLWNLILNAKHALRNEKKILVKTGNLHSSNILNSVDLVKEDQNFAMIEVLDTGAGIEARLMEKIFDPFFTTRDVGEGTGLGLSTALGFVRQSGGYLSVTSEPDKGSCFRILLPLVDAKKTLEVSKPKRDQSIKMGKGHKVLVCDDEPILRALVAEAMISEGFEVLQAENGEEGLKIFHKNYKDIALIISDLTMPKMSGHQLFREARKLKIDLRCVFITGYSRQKLQDDLDPKYISEIEKPFSIYTLLENVYDLLEIGRS